MSGMIREEALAWDDHITRMAALALASKIMEEAEAERHKIVEDEARAGMDECDECDECDVWEAKFYDLADAYMAALGDVENIRL